jgi:hypothetical protein
MTGRRGTFWLWLIASLLAYAWLGYGQSRTDFGTLIGTFGLLFSGYGLAIRGTTLASERSLLLAAGLFRLIFLLAIPALSDDYVRFIWDGRWLAEGRNPYLILPTEYPDRALFSHLNSPGYYTVYPPLNQFLFGLGAWWFPNHLFGHLIVLRLVIFTGEAGTVALLRTLLRRSGKPTRLALLYALNPLVIVELSGNLHFEGVVLALLLLAIFWLENGRVWFSALAWGLAVAVKLIPLLFLPLLIRRIGWGRSLAFGLLVGLVNVALFLPFLEPALVENFTSSLSLYFRKFEFNASVYYLVREGGFWWKGYNIIQKAGPWLLAISTLGIGYLALRRSANTGFPWTKLLFIHTLYLALATTVHPWYLTYLVAFATFTPYRYPLVWSATAVLSYATYATAGFQENLGLTALEYAVVYGYLFWEVRRQASSRLSAA